MLVPLQIKKVLLLLLLSCCVFTNAQKHAAKIDSLKRKLQENIHDTTRAKVLISLSSHALAQGEHKAALDWGLQSMNLAEKIQFKRLLGGIYNGVANSYVGLSNYPKGMEFHQKALRNRLERNDKSGISGSYNNIAIIYYNLSDFPRALEYFQKSLKMQEELKNDYYIAACIGNIAVIYDNLNDDSLSMVYQQKSFDMHEKMGNKTDMVASLNNLGELTRKKNELEKSLTFFNRALEIAKTLDEIEGMKNTLGNIGVNYLMMKKPKEAMEILLEAKKYNETQNDKKDESILLSHMAEAYTLMGNTNEAIHFFQESYNMAKSIGILKEQKSAAEGLYNSYKEKNDFKNAMAYLEIAKKLNDSIFNSNTTESLNSLKTQFALDRQEVQLNQKAEEETKKQEEEKAKQRTIIYIAIGVLVLVLVFSYFLYQRFRITRQQNKIIEHQKIVVEEKNKEITDSIRYAKRIQQTLLANTELMTASLPGHFVFFKPKDIVSGDFYWATKAARRSDNGEDAQSFVSITPLFYLAVCDSTGHGVPGAFMSLLNISFLNEAINEKNIRKPNEILNYVRKRLIDNISQEGAQDGMDAILLCFDPEENEDGKIKISYAAANNTPVIVTQRGDKKEIVILEGDKMPVGKGIRSDPFTLRTIELKKNDSIYLYTDGYADQFGGPKGKKFKYRQLHNLFLSMDGLPEEQQRNTLATTFEAWKGKLEQVDDVCVIGVKI
jgi:serine phosphatase RsbU (regulator of sigma subunit)